MYYMKSFLWKIFFKKLVKYTINVNSGHLGVWDYYYFFDDLYFLKFFNEPTLLSSYIFKDYQIA